MPLLSKDPTDPKLLNERLSNEFAQFLLKTINPRGSKRFSSAQEMLSALEEIGVDNILEEKSFDIVELTNPDKLYHTEIAIFQTGNYFKLYDGMHEYIDLNKSINTVLSRFKVNLNKFKPSLDQEIRIQIKVESKLVINEVFWKGGAKTFTEGNINKVYISLKEVFEDNKEKIKEYKVNVEGLNIVEYINSLYSQSKKGNFGTRANYSLSKFDKLTYSPSKLDRKLIPDILEGEYKLLIITGNAGDGKTAFIRKIEEDNSIDDLERYEHKNGAKFKINGIPFESNYDGSQDQDEKANNNVLEEFFKPFENLDEYNRSKEGRIIAINEGRLVEFLSTSEKHKKLTKIIEDYFYNEGHFELPGGLMIINLNLRSVVAQEDKDQSLFRKQIKALTNKKLWTKCESCVFANRCFIKYNIDSFNDEAVGEEVITRLEWLLRTAILKRELHVTMRDLRSFIAFVLTRDIECEEIEHLYEESQSNHQKYWQNYYFNITNPQNEDSANQDRLIKLLRETDIGEVALPDLDRDLFFGKINAKSYLEFATRTVNLLESFNNNKIWIPAYEQTDELIGRIKDIQKSIIRHHYFEGKADLLSIHNNFNTDETDDNNSIQMPSYLLRLPYHSVFKFVNVLTKNQVDENTKKSISRAISLNEGCDNNGIDKNYLVLSSSEIKDPFSMSFRLFTLSDFELFVNRTDHLVKYLEYEPDSLTFRHKTETHIKLTLSLDLYEMLYFIQQGFSPSLNDLRGKFIELVIFKNLLSNLSYNEVIVTNDNMDFFRISNDTHNRLFLEPMKF